MACVCRCWIGYARLSKYDAVGNPSERAVDCQRQPRTAGIGWCPCRFGNEQRVDGVEVIIEILAPSVRRPAYRWLRPAVIRRGGHQKLPALKSASDRFRL